MLREILEETGEAVDAVEYLQALDVPLDNEVWGRLHVFRGRINRPASELLLGEGQEHRFFAVEELDGVEIVPEIREVLAEFVTSPEYGSAAFGSHAGAPRHPSPLPGEEGTAMCPSPLAPVYTSDSHSFGSTSPSPRQEWGPGGEDSPAAPRP